MNYELFGLCINGVLTLITLGIAITGLVQALAAKESNATAKTAAEFAEKALKTTERADILLNGAQINLPMSNVFDGHSWVGLQFKNFGRTRANRVKFDCTLVFAGMPDQAAPELPEMVVASGDTPTVTFDRFIEFMNLETFTKVVRMQILLQFVATVSYDDVFGNHHTSYAKGTLKDPVRRLFSVDETRAD